MKNGISYSYSELYAFICNIHNYLESRLNNKNPIIVYGHKEIFMKATILSCSFLGIPYVPVDISTPNERIEEIIKQVKPSLIIGNYQSSYCDSVDEKSIIQIMNGNVKKEIDDIRMKENDIFYIIFTSGTTGKPKGVKVLYKNLDSCIKWLTKMLNPKDDVIINQAIFSFDLSVADFYLSLINNNQHFITSDLTLYNYYKVFEQLKQSNGSIAIFTPSYAQMLMADKSFNEKLLPRLRIIVFCGEILLEKTVKKIKERFRNIRIINCYGPTEATFAVTSYEIKKIMEEKIPIGFPKEDVKIYILDGNLKEVQNEEIGQIAISGKSLCDGYLNDEGAEKFIQYDGNRTYLTGDLGYIKNGCLYYIGRMDDQIKFKGYRIEITDIENNLNKLEYIEKSKVLTLNENGKTSKIIAFVKVNESIIPKKIKEDLKRFLPTYMVPEIKIVEAFPLNKNGKIDINYLRSMIDGTKDC